MESSQFSTTGNTDYLTTENPDYSATTSSQLSSTNNQQNLYLSVTQQELGDLHREALSETFSTETDMLLSKSEKQKLWWIEFYHILIFLFIFVIAWHLATRMIFIYLEFKAMIDWIDENIKARANLSASEQLKYYNFTSGYAIAYYYVYPHMLTNPFLNNAFPASVVYSFYTPNYFKLMTYESIQEMFVYASMGSFCQPSQNDGGGPRIACMRAPDPNEIICNTYAQQYAPCSSVCIKGTSMSGFEWGVSTSGSFFAGTVIGGAPGAIAATTAQVFINILSNQENANVAAAEQYCTPPTT